MEIIYLKVNLILIIVDCVVISFILWLYFKMEFFVGFFFGVLKVVFECFFYSGLFFLGEVGGIDNII